MKWCLALLAALLANHVRAEVPKELADFVQKADKAYEWKSNGKIETPASTVNHSGNWLSRG